MKILVTGGAGFIGSHVVDAYVALGHDVVVVDNLYSGKRENVNPKARLFEVDILSPAVEDVVRAERPEIINHHAAQMDVRLSVASPVFDAEVNLIGTLRLIEAGRQSGLRKVLFASSGGVVYGEQERFPATESDPTAPLCPYGVTKRAGEHYLHYYHTVHGMPYVAFRYANVYGPRQNPHGEAGVVAIFGEKVLAGETLTVNGDGKQTRDYVFVEDLVRANVAALDAPFVGPVNLGTGIETDVNQLAQALIRIGDGRSKAVNAPAKAGEQRRSVLDCSRARRELGWQPTISLDEGLARTFESLRRKRPSGPS